MPSKCVVRNAQYRCSGLNKRERHNERKNADYQNEDIIKERAAHNIYFKQSSGGYEKMFDALCADKTISTHGLGKDPFIVDELVFDVNSGCFEEKGGYEYAKAFFEEAYRCAVNEIGGEQYILSAVMHADERNKPLSEQLGHDVYHYHLHVVYVPVVQKELYFKKNNKNPELAGKLKEVITQVSHSKKWPRFKQLDENGEVKRNAKGKTMLVNSYSLLQDRYFQHMREAGFQGFERGERGSDAQHLRVLEYKTQQEKKRAAAINAQLKEKQKTLAELDGKAAKQKKELEDIEKKTRLAKKEASSFADIDKMPDKRTIMGDIALSPANWKSLSNLAKEGLKSRSIAENFREKIDSLLCKISSLENSLKQYKSQGITDAMRFYQAQQRAPKRLARMIADIMQKPPESSDTQSIAKEQKHSTYIEM